MRDRQIVEKIVEVFAEQFSVEASAEDVRLAIANIAGFFAVLADWDSRDVVSGRPAESDPAPSQAPNSEETTSGHPNPRVGASQEEGES
jgi:hypothetical protein